MDDLLHTIETPGESRGTISDIASLGSDDAVAEAETLKDGDFDWSRDDSVILHEQLAMAVYRNRADGIVIRQERNGYDEEDHFVVVRDEQALRVLIAALQRELKGGGR